MGDTRYFLSVNLAGELIEKEVSLEEFCKAERVAGFFPSMAYDDPRAAITPATGGWGGSGVRGRIEHG